VIAVSTRNWSSSALRREMGPEFGKAQLHDHQAAGLRLASSARCEMSPRAPQGAARRGGR
jgi:hypothetical protein